MALVDTVYLESALREHPRVAATLDRLGKTEVIECERYGEVFNVGAQNFRLQKRRPALILAEKHGRRVLAAPPGYSIGRRANFYFSHILNCLYDCRYCFLQGMYRSANYAWFVNYEDFERGIDEVRETADEPCFFSGYDCDSLAMESLTGFAARFVPFFSDRPDAWLELRTKSLNTRALEESDPVPNIVTAYTLTPALVAREIEHGAPPVERRIARLRVLAEMGWPVGIRLDPLIPWPGFEALYGELIDEVLASVDPERIHSVTLGPMRFPKAMHDRIVRLYPEEPLFARQETVLRDGQVSCSPEHEEEMVGFVEERLLRELPASRVFRQTEPDAVTVG